MPIRVRLTLLFAGGTALVLVLASVLFVHFMDRELRGSIDSDLRARSDTISQLFSKAPGPVTLPNQPNGVAQVFDAAGRLVASRGAGRAPLLTPADLRAATRRPLSVSRTLNEELPTPAGDHTRLLAVPISRADGTWVLVVGSSLEPADTAVDRLRFAIAIGGPATVVIAVLAAWFLASAALRPVERMRHQVALMSPSEPQPALSVPSTRDEVAALATTMNDLLSRVGVAIARERAFVADAAHELRTPLAILRAELELAGRPGRSHEQLTQAIGAAAEESDRLSRLAEDLLFLARSDDAGQQLRRQPTDIRPLLAAAAAARDVDPGERPPITVAADPALVADVDPDRLRQAVDNLIDNAIRHSPPNGAITVAGCRDNGALVVAVTDDGPGFPPEFLPHAFERFRRADTARARVDGGAGLGLAIVRSIAEAHLGTASATNRPSGGAVVEVRLPVDQGH
ncbi:MAG: putative transrane sensory transduction histidine kinase for metal resistance [Acidimicrobiales bacterium]|jgi:two-component system OmpR family sensor kinase|nr:putative transrane sensory transduction histidine kinase for metal resistance [Acidimicrobiales bacterium]